MTSPIRVGLAGYGMAGRVFHAPLISVEPGLTLCSVATRQTAAVNQDWPEAAPIPDPLVLTRSDDIDLLIIATPNDTHAPLARAALEAGKHVVIDKPFAVSLGEAYDLVELAERKGRLLSVFHNRRWDSDYLTVREAIENCLIGEVAHFESHFDRFRPAVRDRWRERAGPGSGIWFDLGPHLVDQALQLFGMPEKIVANLASQRSGAQTDDWAHVVLEYGDRRVILHASMVVAGGNARFRVHGAAGSIVKVGADRQESQLLEGLRPGDSDWGVDPDPLQHWDAEGNQRLLPALSGDQGSYYRGIAAALRGDAANPVSPDEALAVMAVVEAVLRSAREGASVAPDGMGPYTLSRPARDR